MNGFDDFDTQVTAEEFYSEMGEDEQVQDDTPYPHDLDGFEYPEFDG